MVFVVGSVSMVLPHRGLLDRRFGSMPMGFPNVVKFKSQIVTCGLNLDHAYISHDVLSLLENGTSRKAPIIVLSSYIPNMKGFLAYAYIALATCASYAHGSGSWAGTNLYFIQGLSDSDQDAYISKLASYNTKVVRVWVNGQSKGCVKGSNIVQDIPALETTLGQYNDVTLDALDKVLVKLAAKNIKAVISPHDANSLIGDYRK